MCSEAAGEEGRHAGSKFRKAVNMKPEIQDETGGDNAAGP